MKKLLVTAFVASLLMLALALPAAAEHNAEHVAQTTANLQEAYLPPGAGPLMSLYGIGRYGEERTLYLYDLAALCQNQGGYYYYGADGYWYWNDCAGARY